MIGAIRMHSLPISTAFKKPTWLKSSVQNRYRTPHELDKKNGESAQEFCILERKSTNKNMFIHESKDFPDISFLRENSALILKIFNTEYNGDNIIQSSKISVGELEIIYCIVEEFRDKLFSVEDSKSLNSTSSVNKYGKTSVQEEEYSIFNPLLQSEKCKSMPENSKTLSALSSLKCINNKQIEILNYFKESEVNITKVLLEINKLDSTFKEIIAIYMNMKTEDIKNSNESLVLSLDSSPTKNSVDHSNSTKEILKTSLQLYRKPLFLILTTNRVVVFIATHCLFTIIVDYSIDKGFSLTEGKFALLTAHLGDFVGRLCLGWVTDKGYVKVSKYMLVITSVNSIALIYLPFIQSYTSMLITLALIGVLQGSVHVQLYGVLSQYMKSEEKSIAMGCINLLPGVFGFGIPAYIGYFRDTLGSYNYIFYINGTFGLIFGLLWTLSPYLQEFAVEDAGKKVIFSKNL